MERFFFFWSSGPESLPKAFFRTLETFKKMLSHFLKERGSTGRREDWAKTDPYRWLRFTSSAVDVKEPRPACHLTRGTGTPRRESSLAQLGLWTSAFYGMLPCTGLREALERAEDEKPDSDDEDDDEGAAGKKGGAKVKGNKVAPADGGGQGADNKTEVTQVVEVPVENHALEVEDVEVA
ncbi:hypothetical protein ACOMHN_010059 [Nucella lapillus]